MGALLTEPEAAEMLHMSARLLREKRRMGLIRYVALSARKVAYRPEDCREYIDSQTRIAVPLATSHNGKPAKQSRPGNVVPFSKRKAGR